MIKIIIFDLDGTLYRSKELSERFSAAAYATMAKFKKISNEEAQRLVEQRKEELKKEKGHSVPYTLTLLSYDIPIEFWHQENINFFDPRRYLKRNQRLVANIKKLKNKYLLAILTNNNKVQTERVIEAIGLKDLFDYIFTYNTFQILKPDINLFKKVLEKLRLAPEECLVVGDRYDIDLEPAKKLGMEILEVKGPEDLFNIFYKHHSR